MISDVLKVVEAILGIVDRAKGNYKESFSGVVEPVFLQLVTVHRDYRRSIMTVAGYAAKGRSPDIIEKLIETQRLELEPIRSQIFSIVAATETAKHLGFPKEIVAFMDSCHAYLSFTADNYEPPLGYESYKAGYSNLLELAAIMKNVPEHEVEERLRRLETRILKNWSNVCDAYALAKLRLHA